MFSEFHLTFLQRPGQIQLTGCVYMVSFHAVLHSPNPTSYIRLWSWLHGLAFCLGNRRGIILCKNHILWLHMVAHKRAEFNIVIVVCFLKITLPNLFLYVGCFMDHYSQYFPLYMYVFKLQFLLTFFLYVGCSFGSLLLTLFSIRKMFFKTVYAPCCFLNHSS